LPPHPEGVDPPPLVVLLGFPIFPRCFDHTLLQSLRGLPHFRPHRPRGVSSPSDWLALFFKPSPALISFSSLICFFFLPPFVFTNMAKQCRPTNSFLVHVTLGSSPGAPLCLSSLPTLNVSPGFPLPAYFFPTVSGWLVPNKFEPLFFVIFLWLSSPSF